MQRRSGLLHLASPRSLRLIANATTPRFMACADAAGFTPLSLPTASQQPQSPEVGSDKPVG